MGELYRSEDEIRFCLFGNLADKAQKALMHTMGIDNPFPEDYKSWEDRRSEIEKRFHTTLTKRQAHIHLTLEQASGDIQATVREAVIDEMLEAFP